MGGHVSRSFKYCCLRQATCIPQDQWMLKNVSCPKLLPAKRRSQLSHLKLQDVRAPLGDGTFADDHGSSIDGEHESFVKGAHLQGQEITHGSPASSEPSAHSQALGKLALSTGMKGLKDDPTTPWQDALLEGE